MIPDLRTKEPHREAIDRTNVVMEDIVDKLLSASGHLCRFEEEGDSKFGGVFVTALRQTRETIELLERRVNDIRQEMNRADREKGKAN